MILRSPTEHENTDLRHAGMDSRHPGSRGCSGDIHVSLDSSTPCWNDAIEGFCFKLIEAPPPVFSKKSAKFTKGLNFSDFFTFSA